MGFFSKISGAEIARPIDAIGNAIDKVFTSDEERLQGRAVLAKLALHQSELQVELNKVEAQDRRFFNSGWRPAIGWVAVFSLALYFIPQFVIGTYLWTVQCIQTEAIVPYPVDAARLFELVLGMLGIGAFRMAEKLAGRTK